MFGALGLGLIAALAWGVHDILVRHVSLSVGVLQSLVTVLFFGAVAQGVLAGFASRFVDLNPDGLLLAAASGVAFCFACVGHYNAFARGPLRLVAPLIGCYAVLSFLIAAFSGQSVTAGQWAMLFLLIAGIALVAREAEEEKQVPDGFAMTMIYCGMAITGFATSFAFGQSASAVSDPVAMGWIARCVATLCAVVVFVMAGFLSDNKPISPDGKTWMILAGMGVLDALALGVVLAAGSFDRPEFASAGASTFGLVTVVLAWLFLREKISPVQWVGIFAVFIAIAKLAASA